MSREAQDVELASQREPTGLWTWAVLGVGLGTAAFLVVAMGGLYAFIRLTVTPPPIPEPARFPAPRIQSDPAGDLRDLQAAQREQLRGYAWVDREGGRLRIPVARAMEILAGRGQAAYAPLEEAEPGVPFPVRPQATRTAPP